MVVKQKIELPLDCRYIFVNYNKSLKPFRSTKEVLHFIEGNRPALTDSIVQAFLGAPIFSLTPIIPNLKKYLTN